MLTSHIPLVSRLRSAGVCVLPLVGQPLPLPFSNTFRFFIQNRLVMYHYNVARSVQKVSITWAKVAGLDPPQYSPVTAVTVMLGAAQLTAGSLTPVSLGAEPSGKVGMAVGMLSIWPDGTQI